MDRWKKLNIFNIFVLKNYFYINFGEHYPKEIVNIINIFYHKLFKISISCGGNFTILLINGDLYSWGDNEFGQLGSNYCEVTKSFKRCNNPQKFGLKNIVKIKCGNYHSLALTTSNKIYSWGDNSVGQLGIGSSSLSGCQKIMIDDIQVPCNKIFCGGNNSGGIFSENSAIYMWGYNGFKQLGFGDNKNKPQKFNLKSINKISYGDIFTMILTISGVIYIWGYNMRYNLEFGHNKSQIFNLKSIRKICCGIDVKMALTTSGEIYMWGNNEYGQLGLGHKIYKNKPQKLSLKNIRKICCSGFHSMALTNCGNIYVWGHNDTWQLGMGHNKDLLEPQKLESLNNVKTIKCGYKHSIAITEINEIFVWGYNWYGQLGLGDYENKKVPQKLDLKIY